MTEINFDYIRRLIQLDEASIDRLPKNMKARAEWARQALDHPDQHEIDFGRYGSENYTIAVYNPDDNTWYDVAGHFHGKSPSETIVRNAAKAQAYKDKQEAIMLIESSILEPYGVTCLDELSKLFYDSRRGESRICQNCGEKESDKKFHWHHIDPDIRRQMELWLDDAKKVDFQSNKDEFVEQYDGYVCWARDYYTVDLSETILLCPKCHRRIHREEA